MGYITIDYYRNTYNGIPVAGDATLQGYIDRASRTIDRLTRFTITDLSSYSAYVQDKVMLATASQVEYLAEYGPTSTTVEGGGGDFSIGAYSEKGGGSSSSFVGSSDVVDYLNAAGLMYAGVQTLDGGYCG